LFSNATIDDLTRLEVLAKRLVFEHSKVAQLAQELNTVDADAEIKELHSRIKKVYERVNMDASTRC